MLRWINSMQADEEGERSVCVGEFLIGRYYGGQPRSFHLHGRKGTSLSRLAAHPDSRVSASTLWRCIALALQSRVLPLAVAEKLTWAQRRALLPVRDAEQLCQLASQAATHEWSAAEVAASVLAATTTCRPGPRPSLPGVRLAAQLARVFDRALPELSGRELAPAELEALERETGRQRAWFAAAGGAA